MNNRFTARVAEAYGSHSEKYVSVLEPILTPMAEELVGLSNLTRGQHVLDLATGTGLIARTAAGFTDSVVGIDIALSVLAKARQLTAGEISYVMGDAHRLGFESQSFDVVTCSLSLSHFSDVNGVLAEIRRVLRARGRFITSTWGTEGESPSKMAAVEVRNKYLEDRADTFEGTFDEDVWADVNRGRHTLQEAGFENIDVKTAQLTGEHANRADAVEAALAWPVTRYRIARLDPADQRRLTEETVTAIADVDDLHWQSQIHYYQATRSADWKTPS